jgi:hypothetical protein
MAVVNRETTSLHFLFKRDAMVRMLLLTLAIVAGVLSLIVSLSRPLAAQDKEKQEDPAAIERARNTVKMLDDVYKTAIVLVTEKYVQSKKDYPAGRLAVNWFKAVSEKGHHEVRIIDVSGEPYSQANVAKDDFDTEGVRQMKEGKAFFEQIERKAGKSYLRAMTPVPVVMEKCTLCHDNYKSAKPGAAIGALTYKVPIQ